MYTPAGTASYENKIMLCYQQRHAGVRFVPPIILEVNAYFAIPKSYPKKKAALCSQNILRPTCKPDMDNIVKAVADALNGVAYRDDSAIVELRVAKRYGSPERLVVRVSGDLEPEEEVVEGLHHG
jgi:Holliday junction resolvase RusA-like endonuclease